MGFKRPLVRFQSLGPKWEKPLKLLSFDGFFFCLFRPAALFNTLEFYTPKRRFKRDEKTSQNYHNRRKLPHISCLQVLVRCQGENDSLLSASLSSRQ